MFFNPFSGMGGMGGMHSHGFHEEEDGFEEEGDTEGSDSTKFYELLGIQKSATKDEIKKAFRKLCVTAHPDKGGDVEKFKEIQRAYEVLGDEEKREIYDKHGEAGLSQNGRGGGPGDVEDLFDILMGGGGRRGKGGKKQKRQGEDVSCPLNVGMEELYKGTEKKLKVQRNILCKGCEGKGAASGTTAKKCKECKGQGSRLMMRPVGPGMIQQIEVKCPACEGSGQYVAEKDKCKKCKGQRVVKEKKTINVHIDKGMKSGEKIVFKGEADEAPDTETGDIVCTLEMKPHPVFRREGDNLFMRKSITLLEALVGFQFVIEHLDGRRLIVKSDPNVVYRPGDFKSIQNEGFPIKGNPMEKGTLYIEFTIEFPASGSISNKARGELKKALPAPPKIDIPATTHGRTEMNEDGDEKEIPAVEEVSLSDVDMKEERRKHDEQRRQQEMEDEDSDDGGRGRPGGCQPQ